MNIFPQFRLHVTDHGCIPEILRDDTDIWRELIPHYTSRVEALQLIKLHKQIIEADLKKKDYYEYL